MDDLYDRVKHRLRWAGIATIGAALILMICGVLVYRKHHQFIAAANRTRGEVSSFTTRFDNGSTFYKAVIKFTDADGEGHVFESNSSSTTPEGKLGDIVDVLYNPELPADAMIDSFGSLWLLPLILAGMGWFFAVIGTLLIVWPTIQFAVEQRYERIADAAR